MGGSSRKGWITSSTSMEFGMFRVMRRFPSFQPNAFPPGWLYDRLAPKGEYDGCEDGESHPVPQGGWDEDEGSAEARDEVLGRSGGEAEGGGGGLEGQGFGDASVVADDGLDPGRRGGSGQGEAQGDPQGPDEVGRGDDGAAGGRDEGEDPAAPWRSGGGARRGEAGAGQGPAEDEAPEPGEAVGGEAAGVEAEQRPGTAVREVHVIQKVKGGYKVKSSKGKNLSKTLPSRKAARKRLRQVEYWKKHKK